MGGIASSAGSQLRTAHSRLMRIPIMKTTTSPSTSATALPGTTLSPMAISCLSTSLDSGAIHGWIVTLSKEGCKGCDWRN
ncbi:hypothetical protein SRIMM317S_01877 [Streptomyces rimosus subsp. rimosus]